MGIFSNLSKIAQRAVQQKPHYAGGGERRAMTVAPPTNHAQPTALPPKSETQRGADAAREVLKASGRLKQEREEATPRAAPLNGLLGSISALPAGIASAMQKGADAMRQTLNGGALVPPPASPNASGASNWQRDMEKGAAAAREAFKGTGLLGETENGGAPNSTTSFDTEMEKGAAAMRKLLGKE